MSSQYFTEAEIEAMMADLALPDVPLDPSLEAADEDLQEIGPLAQAQPYAPPTRFVPHGSVRVDGEHGNVVFLCDVVWKMHNGCIVNDWLFDLYGGEGAPGNEIRGHYFAKAYRGDNTREVWHKRFDTAHERAAVCDVFLRELNT